MRLPSRPRLRNVQKLPICVHELQKWLRLLLLQSDFSVVVSLLSDTSAFRQHYINYSQSTNGQCSENRLKCVAFFGDTNSSFSELVPSGASVPDTDCCNPSAGDDVLGSFWKFYRILWFTCFRWILCPPTCGDTVM